MTEAGRRNRAVDVAWGDYVTFLAVGERIAPDGLEELIDAHDRGHGALSVRVAEPPATPAGWARMLLTGEETGSVYASFAREALPAAPGFDDQAPAGPAAGAGGGPPRRRPPPPPPPAWRACP